MDKLKTLCKNHATRSETQSTNIQPNLVNIFGNLALTQTKQLTIIILFPECRANIAINHTHDFGIYSKYSPQGPAHFGTFFKQPSQCECTNETKSLISRFTCFDRDYSADFKSENRF